MESRKEFENGEIPVELLRSTRDDCAKKSVETRDRIDFGAISERTITWKSIMTYIVVHVALILLTVHFTYLAFANNGLVLFSWHPTFMCIGYLIFMSEAILVFRDENLLTKNRTHKQRVFLHWMLQVIGSCFIVVGFVAIYLNKSLKNKEHIKTYHGLVGLIAFIVTGIALTGGIWTKYSYQLRSIIRPVIIKMLHGGIGVVSYALAVTASIIALYSHWYDKYGSDAGRLFVWASLIFTGIYVIIKPAILFYHRLRESLL